MKRFRWIIIMAMWISLVNKPTYPQSDSVIHQKTSYLVADSTQTGNNLPENNKQKQQQVAEKKENRQILAAIAILTLTIFLIYNVRSR